MKTFILESNDKSIRAEIKADIFAKNAEVAVAGFDVRFTNMEVVDDEAAIVAGINEAQVINTYKDVYDLCISLNLNLYIVDINEGDTTLLSTGIEVDAGADQAITNGAGDITSVASLVEIGEGSVDSYLWEVVSQPGGGTAVPATPTTLNSVMTNSDAPDGTYVFKLTLTSTTGAVTSDTFECVVTT